MSGPAQHGEQMHVACRHSSDDDYVEQCAHDGVGRWSNQSDQREFQVGRPIGKQGRKGEGRGSRAAAGILLLVGPLGQPERVVITCQLRKGHPSWELPKGGIETADHSNVEAAAAREFCEETGVANDLGGLTALSGFGQSRIHWFLAQVLEESELRWGVIEDKDTLEAKCVTLEEASCILRADHKQLLRDVLKFLRSRKGALR